MGIIRSERALALLLVGFCLFAPVVTNADAKTRAFREQYSQLVERGELREALAKVCYFYQLPCTGVTFRIHDEDEKDAYAYTGLSKKIDLYYPAFKHPTEPMAHPGWLGAIVGHELIHTRQGSVGSVYAQLEKIYRSNDYYVAARELEGWQYMFDNAERFGLNCSMYNEIEFSREYFEWIVQHSGKRPPGDSVPANIPKFQRLSKQCQEWSRKQSLDG